MNNFNRISSKQRRKLYKDSKAKLALALALFLLVVVLIYTQYGLIYKLIKNKYFTEDIKSTSEKADLIVKQTSDFFGFNRILDSHNENADSINTKVNYYTQPWPVHLPFVYYSRAVSKFARSRGFRVDCVESAQNKSMVCTIRSENISNEFIAIVTVEKKRGVRFGNKKIAIIFDDIGDLPSSALTAMLNAGIRFNYFGDTETYPSGNIKKRMIRGEISTILKIPGDFKKLGFLKNLISEKYKRNSGRIKEDTWAAMLFDLHPNIGAFYFENLQKPGGDSLAILMRFASERNLKYIYDGPPPQKQDSLAFSHGLTIVKSPALIDLREHAQDLLEPEIISKLIENYSENGLLIQINAPNTDIRSLSSLWNTLGELGIKRLSCMQLLESIEFL
jgi:hypothetical protein